MPGADGYPEGTTALNSDSEQRSLVKVVQLLNASGGGGGTNNKSGAGSPVGVVTPDYVGQGYTDTVNPHHQWQAVGLTSADWFEIV